MGVPCIFVRSAASAVPHHRQPAAESIRSFSPWRSGPTWNWLEALALVRRERMNELLERHAPLQDFHTCPRCGCGGVVWCGVGWGGGGGAVVRTFLRNSSCRFTPRLTWAGQDGPRRAEARVSMMRQAGLSRRAWRGTGGGCRSRSIVVTQVSIPTHLIPEHLFDELVVGRALSSQIDCTSLTSSETQASILARIHFL